MSRSITQSVLQRSEEHTSELQSRENLVCRLLLEKKKKKKIYFTLLIKKKKQISSDILKNRRKKNFITISSHAFSYPCKVTDFLCLFFFFNDTATTEIYTLSLHDALPIAVVSRRKDQHVLLQALPLVRP